MSAADGSREATRVRLVSPQQSAPPLNQPRSSQEAASIRVQQLLLRFQHQKEIFITRVYLVAVTFVVLTLFQWLVLKTDGRFFQDVEHYLKRHEFVSNLASILGMVILAIFLFNRALRYSQPFNTIVALLIVELFTLGFVDIVIASEVESLVVMIFLTMSVFAALTVLAISVSRDLSQDIAALALVSILFFAGTAVYLLLVLTLSFYFPTALFASCMLLLEMLYILYFAQIVFATGSQGLRWKDHAFASLMVYFNYIVLLCTALVLQESLLSSRLAGAR